LAQDKVDVTSDHIDAIQKMITLLGSAKDLAEFLEVHRTNVYLWLKGYQPIPVKHAEKLEKAFPNEIDVLTLRPDLKQYIKYLK
jgi:DNA-binding transcriptional regulator YdaS (Cro superfamily)